MAQRDAQIAQQKLEGRSDGMNGIDVSLASSFGFIYIFLVNLFKEGNLCTNTLFFISRNFFYVHCLNKIKLKMLLVLQKV